MPQRAVILTRVSYGDSKTISPEHQEEDCRKKAVELGMEVVYVGTEVNRKRDAMETSVELARIRQMMYRRQIQAIFVWAYDRIGCNDEEFNLLWYEARTCEVKIISCTEPPYEETPEGAFRRHMDTYFRARELATTRARLAWGMQKRLSAGKMWPNWRAPYGCVWANEDKSALVFDEATKRHVLRIFRDIASGISASQLAVQLAKEGILSPTGKNHWDAGTICDIIHNPLYRGIAVVRRRSVPERIVFDVTKGIHVSRRNRDDDYEEVVLPSGTVPALVDEETWRRAEETLAGKFLGQRRGNLEEKYLLRGGFVVCSKCGSALRPAYGRNHQLIYACRSNGSMLCKTGASVRVTQQHLDTAVWADIIDLCSQPALLERRLAELQEEFATPGEVHIRGMRAELKELSTQQQRLLDAIQMGQDSPTALMERYNAVSVAVEKQEQLIKTAESRASSWSKVERQFKDTIDACRQLSRQHEVPYADRRSLLRQLAVFVIVFPKGRRQDTPVYRFTFFSPPVGDETSPQMCSDVASRKSFSTGYSRM